MNNYEEILLERVQVFTGKLTQKQREGCLTEELSLCIRLAQLHGQLDNPKVSVQFWQSCMQIAADLGEEDEIWRAAAEIAKIYCKEGQIDEAEEFMKEHLKAENGSEPLRLSLLKAETILAMTRNNNKEMSVKEFLHCERALKILDSAFESTTSKNIWWWEAVAFRAELLRKLAKFDESRFKEAIDVVNAIQSNGIDGNVLMSLRCKALLAKIYFDMREYATALEAAISAIDQYKSEAANANYRPRRRIYCEMLFLAGRSLRYQKDFNFALQNLLLAKDEAQALAVEKEFMEEISKVTQESINAQAAADEAALLQRKKNPSAIDLEELADKLAVVGDFQGQLDLLEKCRAITTGESAHKRLDKKLLKLYFYELRNWSEVLKIESDDWRNLILKGRACMNLCKFEQAEEFLLEASRRSNENLAAQAALFFYYRQRGKMTLAEKYEAEALSLETIFELNAKSPNRCCLIDPNFSYFATRKPSNSLMKMIGSGMMMRTKTRKTKGLQLKRRRGPSRLHTNVVKVRRAKEHDKDSGMSDFIVSDDHIESEESDSERSESDTRKLETNRSLIVISSSDESDPDTLKQNIFKAPAAEFAFDSPLMIRTETLDQPIPIDCDSPMKNGCDSPLRVNFDTDIETETDDGRDEYCDLVKCLDYKAGSDKENLMVKSLNSNTQISQNTHVTPSTQITQPSIQITPNAQITQSTHVTQNTPHSTQLTPHSTHTARVVVRFKKGLEILIPTSFDVTVNEFIKTAQTRLNHLFPEESKGLGQICGLSLNNSAMLFPEDKLNLVLAGDSETLQAHFKQPQPPQQKKLPTSAGFEIGSPSKLNSIDEDFKRKIQILNLKADAINEIKFLKTFQDRFKTGDVLDLSGLSLDSVKISEYYPFINKFLKFSNNFKQLNLKENLLCDQDLKSLTTCSCEEVNLSANFLQKPNVKMFLNCDFIDFSYNPIDATWLINQNFKGLNLIGCFELSAIEVCDELGTALSNLKKLKLSIIPDGRFFANLCSGTLEEVEFFAVDWKSENLVELSYLDLLKSLTFTSCTFNRVALEALGKVLKRTCSLEVLSFTEIEFEEEDWLLIQEGIKGNFSLKQVIKEDKIER